MRGGTLPTKLEYVERLEEMVTSERVPRIRPTSYPRRKHRVQEKPNGKTEWDDFSRDTLAQILGQPTLKMGHHDIEARTLTLKY
jgi:hypothetical protein